MRGQDKYAPLRERITFLAVVGYLTYHFTSEALRLQRVENDRRLTDLNNEAGRLKDAVSANVSADTFEGFNKRVVRIEAFTTKLAGALGLVVLMLPIIFLIFNYYLDHRILTNTVTTTSTVATTTAP